MANPIQAFKEYLAKSYCMFDGHRYVEQYRIEREFMPVMGFECERCGDRTKQYMGTMMVGVDTYEYMEYGEYDG